MQNLVGETVLHPVYGTGKILSVRDRVLTACFEQGGRRFLYPDAFEDFLTLKNPDKQRDMEEICRKQKKRKADALNEKYSREEREIRLRSMKIHECSQAVFAVSLAETEKILKAGQISTGFYETGRCKGEPRPAGRIMPNTVCLLTESAEGESEKSRIISGAFMVREDFCGNECTDGIIPAHETYRLVLPAENRLLFHDFDAESEELRNWGIVPFQYCSNLKMMHILRKILDVLQETEQSDLAGRFYAYYCERNHLNCDLEAGK